jgi:hypothetical protein
MKDLDHMARLRFIFAVASLILMAGAYAAHAGTRSLELCYASTDTGLTKGSFTLAYYSWPPATALSTSALTVTANAAAPGCYDWTGFTDDNLLNYRFAATITATGVERGARFPMGGAAQVLPWLNQIVVPLQNFSYQRGTNRPPLVTVIQSGLGTNPSGASCSLVMKRAGAASDNHRTLTGTCSVGSYSGAVGSYGATLTYQFSTDDLNMSDCGMLAVCAYTLQWLVTFSDGGIQPIGPLNITVTNF